MTSRNKTTHLLIKNRRNTMNKKFEKLGFYPADILLPKGQDMTKWAVVACDQFTSEPEYW